MRLKAMKPLRKHQRTVARGYKVRIIKPPETLVEQTRRLTWRNAERHTKKKKATSVQYDSYKDRLRVFR